MKQHSSLRLLGVDPGDRWVGLAALDITGNQWSAWTGVLDIKFRTMQEAIHEIMRPSPLGMIVERYQQRPVGHQRFVSPKTPKLIGALEYIMQERGGGFHEVQPNSPLDLQHMPMYRKIEAWRPKWQHCHHQNWTHALSAWRVLSIWMMEALPELAMLLHQDKGKVTFNPVKWLGDPLTVAGHDLIALPATWRIQR
jgi:hypothetical protein